ncbi:hypothetical protein NLI96_g5147 [Meripilus lineatus]|uniref:Uncharacterized protein n=1 Tax=Meripilus lineatus TaxID=2056292 RepID=A0AAD5YJF1_9APHY|nr:hypothetical protein NLI96_g5147 [Physisporinus lineatus]
MDDHHWTQTSGSHAIFNFTGTAIYYLSPKFGRDTFPGGVSTLVSLDGGEPVWVDLSSASSEPSAVLWQALELANITHTVSVICGQNSAGQIGSWGEVDAFKYTVPDPETSVSSSSTSLSSSSASSPAFSSVPSSAPSSSKSSTSLSPASSGTIGSSTTSLPVSTPPSSLRSDSSSQSLSTSSPLSSLLTPSSLPSPSPSLPVSSSSLFSSRPSPSLSSSNPPSIPSPQSSSSSLSVHALSISIPLPRPITLQPLAHYTPLEIHRTQNPLASPTPNSTIGLDSNASETSGSNQLFNAGRLSPSQKGGIAGGSIAAGGFLVVLLALAAKNADKLRYVVASLASSFFGVVLYDCRRLIFVCEDSNLGEIQEFDVGGNTKSIMVTIPTTTGSHKEKGVAFGNIDDTGTNVKPGNYQSSPARLVEDASGTLRWKDGSAEANEEGQFIAENATGRALSIAMGTYDDTSQAKDSERFMPFLMIDSKNFGPNARFTANSDILLHAYRTNGRKGTDNLRDVHVNYSEGLELAGDYGDRVMESRKLDRLTPEDGHRVKELKPITTFYVTSSKGEVKLRIGKNRSEDMKKFRWEQGPGYRFWFRKGKKGKSKEGDRTSSLNPEV